MGIQELEAAMANLFDLANEPEQAEQLYQDWFERHPIVTQLLGYVRVLPHPVLETQRGDGSDEEFIPDFMGQRANGLWEIIEIKRSDTPVLPAADRRREFYASFRKYISQCHEYSKYFEDFAHRKAFEARYSTTIRHTKVRSVLIAGWGEEDRALVHDLIADERLLEFMTYDELFTKIETAWRVHEEENEGLPGIGFFLQVAFPRLPRQGERMWVADFGANEGAGRVSVFLSDDALFVHVLDESGTLHAMRVEIADAIGREIFLGFELGFHKRFAVGRVWIDDRVETMRWAPFRLPSVESLGLAFVFGSDMTAAGRGEFLLAKSGVLRSMLTLYERIEVRRFMKVNKAMQCMHFYEGSLMHNEGHPRFSTFRKVRYGGQEIAVAQAPSTTLTAGELGRGPIAVSDLTRYLATLAAGGS